jgi:ribosomal protein S18 acetylase RimI-like enzyme
MDAEIVRPSLADAQCLAEVHVSTWQDAYQGMIPDAELAALTPAWRLPMWRRVLGEHPERALAARVADELVGFALFGACREDAVLGELFALYVLPAHQGTGCGRALAQGALAGLAAAGHRDAVLWVAAGNARAIRFYERGGWVDDAVSAQVEVRPGVHLLERRYRRAVP